jgi:hypothetical protein
MVTVPPTAAEPPVSEATEIETELITTGFTVSEAVALPLSVAVIVAFVALFTSEVVSEKVAIVLPAATVTDAGTVTALLLLTSATESPPVGAALLSVTVPVAVPVPPKTEPGEIDTELMTTGLTVSDAVLLPLKVAVTVTLVTEDTTSDVAAKVPVVCPAAIVIEAGTVAADVALLLSVIVTPPVGAAVLSVTVPVAFAIPPKTDDGLIESKLTVTGLTVNVAVCPPL